MNPVLESLSGALTEKLKKTSMPDWISPMLATLTHDHFSDPDWIYERKLDGVRCLLFRKSRGVSIVSRNRKNQDTYYPEIVDALEKLEGRAILDSELVTFDRNGVTSFSRMQNRMHVRSPSDRLIRDVPVIAYLFDILHLDGYDLTGLPLGERKKILKKAFSFDDPLRYLTHRNEKGEAYLQQGCEQGWEGVIAKDAGSTYIHKRSTKWLKFKCTRGQEFVICGYTEPRGERVGFGALLLGYYADGALRYAGRVGTGFDDRFLKDLRRRMETLGRKTSPFEEFDAKDDAVTWIRPELVGEVAFTEWTSAGRLRHPRFLGLRKDKDARDVVREDEHAA